MSRVRWLRQTDADVCGHGLGPSLLMAQARAYLRSLALSCFDAGELLRRPNEILVVDSDVKDCLTWLLARLDPRARTLACASAGHVTGRAGKASIVGACFRGSSRSFMNIPG